MLKSIFPPFTEVVSAAAAAKSLQSCLTLHDPVYSSLPGSSVLGFSGQEYWSGLPLPSPTEVARREQITFLEVLFCHLVLVIGLFDLEEET